MGKKIVTLVIGLILLSCEGEFKPFENETTSLVALEGPIGRCEDGEITNDLNIIDIVFTWSFNLGSNLETGTLEIYDRDLTELIRSEEIELSKGTTTIDLERGQWYSWRVVNAENTIISNGAEEFYSELLLNEFAPYPVEINVSNDLENFTFIWSSPEQETQINSLTYEAYLSAGYATESIDFYTPEFEFPKKYTPTFNGNDFNLNIVQPRYGSDGLVAGRWYVFKVETKNNNGLSTSAYQKFYNE